MARPATAAPARVATRTGGPVHRSHHLQVDVPHRHVCAQLRETDRWVVFLTDIRSYQALPGERAQGAGAPRGRS